MASSTLPYLYGIAGFAAAGYILWCGRRAFRQFASFYCYVIFCLAAGAATWLLTLLAYTPETVTAYYAVKWIKAALEFWILYEILSQVRSQNARMAWAGRSAQGILVCSEGVRLGMHAPPEKLALLAFLQWLFVLLILAQIFIREGYRGLRPKWGGIFFGLVLMVMFKLQVYSLSVGAPGSPDWQRLVQPMELAPWLVWLIVMRQPLSSSRRQILSRLRRLRSLADRGAGVDRNTLPTGLTAQLG